MIVYTRLPAETDHRYHYARWTGSEWRDVELCKAGKWFPLTHLRTHAIRQSKGETEPYYSAGIALDHDNPDEIYLSIPENNVFEIQKWTTSDKGKTWAKQAITKGSKFNNVRPFIIRNAPANVSPRLIWMNNNGKYIHFIKYNSSIKVDIPLSE